MPPGIILGRRESGAQEALRAVQAVRRLYTGDGGPLGARDHQVKGQVLLLDICSHENHREYRFALEIKC